MSATSKTKVTALSSDTDKRFYLQLLYYIFT